MGLKGLINYLGKARKESRFLIFVSPFKVLKELNWAPKRIEEIDDGGAVTLRSFRLELVSMLEPLLLINGHTNLVSGNGLSKRTLALNQLANGTELTACTHCVVLLSVSTSHCKT